MDTIGVVRLSCKCGNSEKKEKKIKIRKGKMHTFHYTLFNYIIIIIIKKIHGFLVAFDIIGKIKFNKWQQFLYTYHEYNMHLCIRNQQNY